MKNHTLAFVDLEMTGLDPIAHEILEIGIVLAKQVDGVDGRQTLELLSEHNIQLIPVHIENADPKGLEVNKYHSRDWSAAVPQKEGLLQAAKILEGTVLVAQNVAGDWAFLMESGHKYGVDFDRATHYHRLDLASMAFGKLYHDPKLFKFSLRELTVYFEVTNQNAHTALSDARATFEVCKKLLAQ
jgi:DNA polymerase III alpha subunit (gram-positive type)